MFLFPMISNRFPSSAAVTLDSKTKKVKKMVVEGP